MLPPPGIAFGRQFIVLWRQAAIRAACSRASRFTEPVLARAGLEPAELLSHRKGAGERREMMFLILILRLSLISHTLPFLDRLQAELTVRAYPCLQSRPCLLGQDEVPDLNHHALVGPFPTVVSPAAILRRVTPAG